MELQILDVYGCKWITVPEDYDTNNCETLNIPDMGVFMKLSAWVSNTLEIPYGWINNVYYEKNRLHIVLSKEALDTHRLTGTIQMCENRWGPCLVGLYEAYSDDEHGYATTYLKISIRFC